MTIIDDSLAALTDLRAALTDDFDEIGCHVFLKSPRTRTRKKEWFKVAMDSAVTRRIKVATEAAARQLLDDANAGHIAEFDFDAMVEGHLAVTRIDEVDGLREWFDSIPADTLDQPFEGDEAVASNASLYVRRLNFPDGRVLVAVTGKSGINVTAAGRGKIAAFFSEQQHEMREVTGSLLTFDGRMDFFLWKDILYVHRMTVLETSTNVREATKKGAVLALASCGTIFELGESTERILEALSGRALLSKRLAAAHKRGFISAMTGQKLKERAEELQLSIEFVEDETTGSVSLRMDPTDAQQVADLVDLLSELFLKSPTTGLEYEALVKKPRQTRKVKAT